MRTSKDVIVGYLGDILGMENHLLKSVEQQLDSGPLNQQARDFLGETRQIVQTHTSQLTQRVNGLGGSLTANVKEAVTGATALAASLLGRMRSQMASKFLRDDYVVLSACAIGYEMLHAAALAAHDEATAELALRHLGEITPLIVRASDLMPELLVGELANEVGEVTTGAVLVARENTRRAWSREHVHAEHA